VTTYDGFELTSRQSHAATRELVSDTLTNHVSPSATALGTVWWLERMTGSRRVVCASHLHYAWLTRPLNPGEINDKANAYFAAKPTSAERKSLPTRHKYRGETR